MDSNNRFIVRRTDSQERFEVLWEKRLNGEPTLKELAEMDEIINRDPLVHQFVLREMEKEALPYYHDGQDSTPLPATSPFKKLVAKLRSVFKRMMVLFIGEVELAVN
ncbi:hypothetical protein HQ865_22340 [Mucilaginibacter mali]|uniref:Uncharacterized protein n=1 Tax=Mucilaginibacter mali TaxID=2740462 RepID=A0A7D4ULZ6_9SPHI|nr:hypothetical protein [Mucilaginibacter mali]QKJ32382.1 hypothetical protein HQ865_22340 [Mucilaginibacter mali]